MKAMEAVSTLLYSQFSMLKTVRKNEAGLEDNGHIMKHLLQTEEHGLTCYMLMAPEGFRHIEKE